MSEEEKQKFIEERVFLHLNKLEEELLDAMKPVFLSYGLKRPYSLTDPTVELFYTRSIDTKMKALLFGFAIIKLFKQMMEKIRDINLDNDEGFVITRQDRILMIGILDRVVHERQYHQKMHQIDYFSTHYETNDAPKMRRV